MGLIQKKATVTDESAAVPDGGLIAALSPSYATHLLLSVCVGACVRMRSVCTRQRQGSEKQQRQKQRNSMSVWKDHHHNLI